MRRANKLIPGIADPDNLRLASWKAAKGKRYSKQVMAWQANLGVNLKTLREQIMAGCVEVGHYHLFKIYDPKERLICAPSFGEQVLHHALMNVCHPYFDRVLIDDSYASRKGKGTHAALKRAAAFSRSQAWYLKLDVRKFFETIHHGILKRQLCRLFKEERLLKIFYDIIDSYENSPERGVPIGNLTSQYFANHFLSGLDHFIKETLLIPAYVRYMDDMVLWHDDKYQLQAALVAVEDFATSKLHSELKPPVLNSTAHGLAFLGYRIYPHHIRLTQQSKLRFLHKMGHVTRQYLSNNWHEKGCQRHALPLLSFTGHADTRPVLYLGELLLD